MKTLDIDLTPAQYHRTEELHLTIARKLGINPSDIGNTRVLRRSLDLRGQIRYHTLLEVYLNDEPLPEPVYKSPFKDCHNAPPVIIVGAGPSGLFAALRALELGLRPILIERGKPVEQRKYDIANITRNKSIDSDSNWCFGEGGAGTYSDGKLFTRSTKRGDIGSVISKFVEHGASPEITIDTHAHIGTDKLSNIIANIRHTIESHGGEYHFGCRMTDLLIADGTVLGIVDQHGTHYEGIAVLLATGHSARDIYELFHKKGWNLEAKPFALGVRVEHPQRLIDDIQYKRRRDQYLPPAAYSLTAQIDGHGVFSFCMCPGGIIVPAATDEGQQVVNGMSNSKRNSKFANSGIAVTVSTQDVPEYAHHGALSLLRFQQDVERHIFHAAGDLINAPTQRLADFCDNRESRTLNPSNYMGDCIASPIHRLLPPFVTKCLQEGFRRFDKKMHGFLTREASVLAVESRTSSPVRIPRGDNFQHPQLKNLYPCGEGAGYAGGIVSSAIDGINCMNSIYQNSPKTIINGI